MSQTELLNSHIQVCSLLSADCVGWLESLVTPGLKRSAVSWILQLKTNRKQYHQLGGWSCLVILGKLGASSSEKGSHKVKILNGRKTPEVWENSGDKGGAWEQTLGTPRDLGHKQMRRESSCTAQTDTTFCPTHLEQQRSPWWGGKLSPVEYSAEGGTSNCMRQSNIILIVPK